ncbi:MAG: riboflavin biosynthesis protein RibF [Eubacteriales bacterium]|nr:riboflavin biosynthesis protein RibF [Eubacteriales bacterium]
MKRDTYALFFDIDGTLFFDGKLSDENRDALIRVRNEGNLVFINTGRSRAWCPDAVINCGVEWDGLLCGSSYIEINKKVYMNDFILPDTVKRIVEFSFEYDIPVMLEGDKNYYTTSRRIANSILIDEDGKETFFASEDLSRITKISFIKPLPKDYYEFFPELYFISFPTYTEGILKGHDKGTVIARTEEILGIPHERTVAIGDSANDTAALDYAATSVVIIHENSEMTHYPADIFSDGEPRCAVASVLAKMFPPTTNTSSAVPAEIPSVGRPEATAEIPSGMAEKPAKACPSGEAETPAEKSPSGEAEMLAEIPSGMAEMLAEKSPSGEAPAKTFCRSEKTKIVELTNEYRCPDKCAVALGFFDGIHTGHKRILDAAIAEAKKLGIKSAVFVFADTPDFKADTLRIMSEEEKIREFSLMGFDYVFRCRFSDVREMSADDFVNEILISSLGAICCVCGENFRFGIGASGNAKRLDGIMRGTGGYAIVCDSIVSDMGQKNGVGENTVSSTLIRSFISCGRIDEANALTYANYSIDTQVEHGKALARTINSPTINQRFARGVIIPKFGVYASRAFVDGKYHISVSNVGVRPTFSEDYINCETHITGISENLYGKRVRVELLKYLRPEIKFSGVEELKNQIEKDIKEAVEYGKTME